MSSKFGSPTQPYKPPAVCHKPPFGPDWDVPPFDEGEWEGFCEAFNEDSLSEGGMTASIRMLPGTGRADWFGSVEAEPYRIELFMDHAAVEEHFDYKVILYFAGMLDVTFTANARKARSMKPFDTGLIYPLPRNPSIRSRFQLWQ